MDEEITKAEIELAIDNLKWEKNQVLMGIQDSFINNLKSSHQEDLK